MVVDLANDERADRLLHALADATRRDIVKRSMTGEHSVSALARGYPVSFAAVQKHVAVLERAELITKHKRGREQIVRVNPDALHAASLVLDGLEAIWRARLERFAAVLNDPT